VSRRNILVKPE